ncbi:MAG TPA: hypothetical protein VHS34_13405 [Terriglobales bacterium]|jgi:hypothetical protein|nr:hypothetical protein [Terriglobales bacterium]
MYPQTTFRLGIAEQRLALLRELAEVLGLAQGALLNSDLDRLQEQNGRQLTLCKTLRTLAGDSAGPGIQASEPAISPPAIFGPGSLSAPIDGDAISRQLQEVRRQVQHLNRVQAALLRRARRSLEISACLRARCALTYAESATDRGILTT